MAGINRKGATFIELIMTLLILAIIGATVVGVIVFFVQLFVYSPPQSDTVKIAREIGDIMFEGENIGNANTQAVRGIRFARAVLTGANAPSTQQFCYTYGYVNAPAATFPTASPDNSANRLSVRFRWKNDATGKHIYRSTSTDAGASWSTETAVPYYNTNSAIQVDDLSQSGTGAVFSYKKIVSGAEADWVSGIDSPSLIRRVILSINVSTASGTSVTTFSNFQGYTDYTTSAELKGFE